NMQSAKSVIPHVRDCWILIRLQRRSYSKPKNSWLKLRRVSQIAKVLLQQILQQWIVTVLRARCIVSNLLHSN
ncbi:MAG: hypothetical protein WA398_09600, partial [Nitrososphaeraceae archaeon]